MHAKCHRYARSIRLFDEFKFNSISQNNIVFKKVYENFKIYDLVINDCQ